MAICYPCLNHQFGKSLSGQLQDIDENATEEERQAYLKAKVSFEGIYATSKKVDDMEDLKALVHRQQQEI